jgi:hydrogenase maturation protease
MKKVLIGGIGNVLLGDDGVGPYIARLLASHYEFEAGVEVADLGTPALDLIDQISGKDAVILIDCINTDDAPGAVLLYRKADIIHNCPAVRMDPHSPALVETLLSADLFGVAPIDVLLVGIAGESYESGCSLSDSVKASVSPAIAEILVELARLDVGYCRREHPVQHGIWWTAVERETRQLSTSAAHPDAGAMEATVPTTVAPAISKKVIRLIEGSPFNVRN